MSTFDRLSRHLRRLLIPLSLLALVAVIGCGEDADGGDEPDPAAEAPTPTGDPIALTPENTGVGVWFGDMPLLVGHSSLDVATNPFGTAVLEVQIIDEKRALDFSPDDIRNNPAKVQAKKRTEELLDEIDDALEATGATDYEDYVLVIDVFRINGSWPVRWDGVKIRDIEEPGAYTYVRDDMRDEEKAIIVDAVAEIAGRRNLTHVVVGSAIDRLQLVNPSDFSNYVSFYGEVYDALKAQWPDLQVSPGLNWDRFITDIAALYTPGGTPEEVTFAHIRQAWTDIGEPLFEKADFLGLKAEPNPEHYSGDPANIPDSQYALLAEIQGDRPVVWHSVHWPVTGGAEKITQRDYLRRFLALNAGNDIDLVAWRAIRDLGPDCERTVNVGGPRSECFAGVLSDSLATNKLSDDFAASAP